MKLKDRLEAAKKLSNKLHTFNIEKPIILAIPRGGVVIGNVIAKELGAKLDIIVSRKVGAPNNPELAIGAVMHDGRFFPNDDIISALNIQKKYIEQEIIVELKEIECRLNKFRGGRDYDLTENTVILVDDGIATGATMFAAIEWVKLQKPERLIVAIPVGPRDTIERLSKVAEVVVLDAPVFFSAVGEFYEVFEQVDDSRVMEIMHDYGYHTKMK